MKKILNQTSNYALVAGNSHEDMMEEINHILSISFSDSEFNMEKLRLQLNISKSKLHATIKKATGKSPGRFLLKKRLDEAMLLMKDYSQNITEIAYKSGFKNSSVFSTSFKTQFGKTPKEVMSNMINGYYHK